MGIVSRAMEKWNKDVAVGDCSGRAAYIAGSDVHLWVKDGNKVQRDKVAELLPCKITWGTKMQLKKFVSNPGQFNKDPFLVIKNKGKIIKFVY